MALLAGLRAIRLQSVAMPTSTATANPIIDLDVLPANHKVHAIFLNLIHTITQHGSSPTAQSRLTQIRAIAGVKIGKRHRSTGTFLEIMARLMRGGSYSFTASVPATNSFAGSRAVRLAVPFADPSALESSDTAVNTELLRDQPLELDIAAPLTLFTGATAYTGTLQPIALVEPTSKNEIGVPVEVNYADFSGGTAKLSRKGRGYSHLVLFKETGAAITSAEVTSVTLRVDGEAVFDRLTVDQLAAVYNYTRSNGAHVATESATAPEGAELVNDQPAYTDGAGTGISVDFLPIYVPGNGYKASGLLWANENVQVDIEGTLTSGSWRLGWRAVEAQSVDQAERAAVKVFGQKPMDFVNKTANGNTGGLTGRVAALLPKRPIFK